MSKNFIQPGNVLNLTAPSGGVVSGDPVLVGAGIFGVVENTAAEDAPMQVKVVGVHKIVKKTGSGQAVSEGDKLYWDGSGKKLTLSLTGNTLCAVAVQAEISAATTVLARIMEPPLATS